MIAKVKVKSGCTEQVFDNDYCDALPITLGSIELDSLKLSWATLSELNNEKFVIYGINDDLTKDSLGTKLGNGTTIQTCQYQFIMPRIYLYAIIKQVDFDGKYEYTKVVVNKTYVRRQAKSRFNNYDILGRKVR